MRDKRAVDELSIDELEQILRIRKREARIQRFRGGESPIEVAPPVPVVVSVAPPPPMAALLPENAVVSQPVNLPTTPPKQEPYFEDDPHPRFEDDLIEISGTVEEPIVPTWMGGVFSKTLLLVELLAVLGLGALLYIAYQGLITVNDNIAKTDSISATSEAQLAQRLIEPTATPLISVGQVVLPGGHVWGSDGQHQFNYNEVPGPYRPVFEQRLNAPREEFSPTIEGGPILVQIPAIGVEASVRSGDDWITLQAGVGHHPFSGNPGVLGNMVLTGHNDIYGEVFKRLPELEAGDEVRVQSTNGQWYTYVVREKQAVDPSEVWVLDQNLGRETPLITLITCYPYRVNTHRMIVFAELVS